MRSQCRQAGRDAGGSQPADTAKSGNSRTKTRRGARDRCNQPRSSHRQRADFGTEGRRAAGCARVRRTVSPMQFRDRRRASLGYGIGGRALPSGKPVEFPRRHSRSRRQSRPRCRDADSACRHRRSAGPGRPGKESRRRVFDGAAARARACRASSSTRATADTIPARRAAG